MANKTVWSKKVSLSDMLMQASCYGERQHHPIEIIIILDEIADSGFFFGVISDREELDGFIGEVPKEQFLICPAYLLPVRYRNGDYSSEA